MRTMMMLTIPLVLAAPACFAADHLTKNVQQLQSPAAGGDCMFFTLAGVAQADAVHSGNPWFAVPRTHPGFREIYAMLLAAQKAGTTVWVRTTGAAGGGPCGLYAGVDFVVADP